MPEPAWQVSVHQWVGDGVTHWHAKLTSVNATREEARAAAEGALQAIECHDELVEALAGCTAVFALLDTSPSLLATPDGERILALARLSASSALAKGARP